MSRLLQNRTHLIVIGGHAIYNSLQYDDPYKENSWFLFDYQKDNQEQYIFIKHIRKGLSLLKKDKNALVVFSGGQTKKEAGKISEGGSYKAVAERCDWWGDGDLADLVFSEEYARDSFENLLFSMCRFKEVTGHFPSKITTISWQQKECRFDFHRRSLRWPKSLFHFIGIGIPEPEDYHLQREKKLAYKPFESDPYGNGPVLMQKRQERNPFHRQPPYKLEFPEIIPFFESHTMITSGLPWKH